MAASGLRGAAVALPVGGLLLLLLASAEAVLAGALGSLAIDVSSANTAVASALRIAAAGSAIGAIGAVAGSRAAARVGADPTDATARASRRTVETATVLGVVAAVLATFAASQVATAIGGEALVRRTAGLTFAENARRGFFQLLAAAALVAAVLAAVRATSGAAGRIISALSIAVVVLTLVVVATAHHRLALYERAYGWTMLRVMAHAAIAWVGFALVCSGLRWAGVGRGRAWSVPLVMLSTTVAFTGLVAADPEARVVEANVDRLLRSGTPAPGASTWSEDDVLGGWRVPADAVPALLARREVIPPALVERICSRQWDRRGVTWRAAASRARAAQAAECAA